MLSHSKRWLDRYRPIGLLVDRHPLPLVWLGTPEGDRMTTPREPPSAARIAEIRRDFEVDAAEYAEVGATEDELTIDHTAVRDLLAALDYAREQITRIAIADFDTPSITLIDSAARVYDHLFREGPQ